MLNLRPYKIWVCKIGSQHLYGEEALSTVKEVFAKNCGRIKFK